MKSVYNTAAAPAAVGPYSQAASAGNLLFLSGQIGLDVRGNLVAKDVVEQTRQVLQNIEAVLHSAGLARENIIKTTIFLTDIKSFALVNEVYDEFFSGLLFPARSTVEVSALPKGALVEIEAIACFE